MATKRELRIQALKDKIAALIAEGTEESIALAESLKERFEFLRTRSKAEIGAAVLAQIADPALDKAGWVRAWGLIHKFGFQHNPQLRDAMKTREAAGDLPADVQAEFTRIVETLPGILDETELDARLTAEQAKATADISQERITRILKNLEYQNETANP